MKYFKWVWDKFAAIAFGVLINLVTPDKTTSLIVAVIVILLFLIISGVIFAKYPKLFGINTGYVTTGIVFDKNYEKVLLSLHKRQNLWIPPGGHITKNELLHEEVVKLIKKESGYSVDFFPFHDSKEFDNICTVVPQPFRVQIEKQMSNEGHYEHYDFLYIFTVSDEIQSDEHTLESKWVEISKIDAMASRRETYKDVVDIIKAALSIVSATNKKED